MTLGQALKIRAEYDRREAAAYRKVRSTTDDPMALLEANIKKPKGLYEANDVIETSRREALGRSSETEGADEIWREMKRAGLEVLERYPKEYRRFK